MHRNVAPNTHSAHYELSPPSRAAAMIHFDSKRFHDPVQNMVEPWVRFAIIDDFTLTLTVSTIALQQFICRATDPPGMAPSMSGETMIEVNTSTHPIVRFIGAEVNSGITAIALPVLKYNMTPLIMILHQVTYPLRTKN